MRDAEVMPTALRIGPRRLDGLLARPPAAAGLVIFAHGSGSGRFSPRNIQVAHELQQAGFATLLMDLLSEREADDRANIFDIPLLGERVADAVRWTAGQRGLSALPVGLFGASTGAAAALVAAAAAPERVAAVVSRGGRPDLAGNMLEQVAAPTLLIVGGADEVVLDLNRQAYAKLRCHKALEIVPGATHLFEEPGALEQVTDLARQWFLRHLAGQGTTE
jgi:putative phosphoribosyl transferase